MNEIIEGLVKNIREKISLNAALLQIAEEAAELSKAACKLARIYDGTNPTPVTEKAAMKEFVEEFDDVLNAASVVGLNPDINRQAQKMARWYMRLLQNDRNEEDEEDEADSD